MIHIVKTKDKKQPFAVINIASEKNRKVLKPSENLRSLDSCWKNIMAEAKLYNATVFYVQDDTTDMASAIWRVVPRADHKRLTTRIKPERKYKPK